MMSFRRKCLLQTVFYVCLVLVMLLPVCVSAQTGKSSSQLKKTGKNRKWHRTHAETPKKTESNQKAAVQQAALLRRQISNREQMITNLNSQIIKMDDEQEQNEKELKQLQKRLSYMKADYAQIVYNAYRNRRLLDKITFILSADDFSQMFRRMRYYNIFSKSIREQSEQISKATDELTKRTRRLCCWKMTNSTPCHRKSRRLKIWNQTDWKNTECRKAKERVAELSADLKAKQQKRREIDAAIQRAVKAEIAKANAERAKKAQNLTLPPLELQVPQVGQLHQPHLQTPVPRLLSPWLPRRKVWTPRS